MGFWKKILGIDDAAPEAPSSTPTTPEAAGMRQPDEPSVVAVDPDQHLLESSLSTLAAAEFHPSRSITIDDITSHDEIKGLVAFRRHPLITLLSLTTLDGEQFFPRVFVDPFTRCRETVDELGDLLQDIAGVTGALTKVNVITDPESTTSGSVRITCGHDVSDLSFDLDSDSGDETTEAELAALLSPAGCAPEILLDVATARKVILWVPENADPGVVDALRAENVGA